MTQNFKDLLRTAFPHIYFTDLRVCEKDGIISFQGVGISYDSDETGSD